MENTDWRAGDNDPNKDHLHLRGEYADTPISVGKNMGSSPLTWRILGFPIVVCLLMRIISTYVENTTSITDTNHISRDHLHLRGEYLSRVSSDF